MRRSTKQWMACLGSAVMAAGVFIQPIQASNKPVFSDGQQEIFVSQPTEQPVEQTAQQNNLALQKPIVFMDWGANPSTIKYNGNGPTIEQVENETVHRLTDGVKVTDEEHRNLEENWVAGGYNEEGRTRALYLNLYRGDSRDYILDLGQLSHIQTLQLHAAGGGCYGINFPTQVTYYLSQDNKTYYEVGSVDSEQAQLDPIHVTCPDGEENTPKHAYFKLDNLNYNARYVRVRFNVPVWIFLDEMEVLGQTVPSETAKPLPEDGILKDPDPVNQYASPEQSGGIADWYLAYQGWGMINGGLSPTFKSTQEYKEIVSYENKNGVSVDWLYDGVTVLPHANTARDGIYNLITGDAKGYAQKSDWKQWIDHIFFYERDGKTYNMDALEQAVKQAKQEMRPTQTLTQKEIDNHKVAVTVAMTPTVYLQNNWGMLDNTLTVTKNEQGEFVFTPSGVRNLDFTLEGHNGDEMAVLSDRASAMNWFLTEVIGQWKQKEYENLTLDGFYYYEEKITASEDKLAEQTIKIYNALIDKLAAETQINLKSYWIPFYLGEGYKNWNEYGFDYAIMQPNYAFENVDTSRIDEAAKLAKKWGLGVEMEYSANKVDGFREYLTKGSLLGYKEGVQAWYWGTWEPSGLANSTDPKQRELYDLTYTYITGKEIPDAEQSILTADMLEVGIKQPTSEQWAEKANANKAVLIDGQKAQAWNGSNEQGSPILAANASHGTGPYTITMNLQKTFAINTLKVNFYEWKSAGVVRPNEVLIEISEDGSSWTQTDILSQSTETPLAQGHSSVEFAIDWKKPMQTQWIRISFDRALKENGIDREGWMGMDEIALFGKAVDPVAPTSTPTAQPTATPTSTPAAQPTITPTPQSTQPQTRNSPQTGDKLLWQPILLLGFSTAALLWIGKKRK